MPRLRSLLYKLVQLAYTLRLLLGDGIGYVRLCRRSLAALAAEQRCRRKHLALYQERQAKPQRVINPTRIALVWLSRWFDWHHALVIMQPVTLIRWHRQGCWLFGGWIGVSGWARVTPQQGCLASEQPIRAFGMALRLSLAITTGVWFLVSAVPVGAQGPREEPKIALVIGNSAYREAPLRNPVNDARAMAQTLGTLGFTVLAHENAAKRAMETAILEFGRRLADGGVGFFYYAGHGLQVRGRNYLVPVDAEIDSEAATRIAAVDMDLLLEQMAEAKNRVNVVILDACRNNPFERRLRGASRGLAAIDAARGTLIAYATAPGAVAADGEGANGLYTEELLQALRVPGLKIEEVFKRVRVAVANRSKGSQTPWESSSLTGDLIVNVTINVAAPAVPASPVDREALFWTSIKDGNDPAAFEAYLKQYPTGPFAVLAKQRLASLAAPPPASSAARFDGLWSVTVECPRTPTGAEGYVLRFFVEVQDGMLHGQHGTDGQPNSLTFTGKIQPDGSAAINARGITGEPKYNTNREPKGTPYGYFATARFDGAQGTGKRIAPPRSCDLTFAKQ